MSGFTFRGLTSKEMFIKAIKSTRPLVAAPKHTFVDIPWRVEGSILIPDTSQQDLTIDVECLLNIPSTHTVYDVGRIWTNWLISDLWNDLIFDDDPLYKYKAVMITTITVDDIRAARSGKVPITLQFRCRPQQYEVTV